MCAYTCTHIYFFILPLLPPSSSLKGIVYEVFRISASSKVNLYLTVLIYRKSNVTGRTGGGWGSLILREGWGEKTHGGGNEQRFVRKRASLKSFPPCQKFPLISPPPLLRFPFALSSPLPKILLSFLCRRTVLVQYRGRVSDAVSMATEERWKEVETTSSGLHINHFLLKVGSWKAFRADDSPSFSLPLSLSRDHSLKAVVVAAVVLEAGN